MSSSPLAAEKDVPNVPLFASRELIRDVMLISGIALTAVAILLAMVLSS